MLKKILLILCFATAPLFATYPYDIPLTDSENITSDTEYTLNLNSGRIVDYLSFQAIYSTETFAGITVTTNAINGTDDTIVSAVVYPAGYGVFLTSTTFSNWYGLTNGTTYFMIPASAGYAKLATTRALAIAGTAIDLPVISSGTGSFILTPIGIQSTSPTSFRLQASNDNSNWYNLSVASITILGSTTPTNYLWDLGFTSYRYIRVKLITGTHGSVKLKLQGYGKRVAP